MGDLASLLMITLMPTAIEADQMEVVRAICFMRERLALLKDAGKKLQVKSTDIEPVNTAELGGPHDDGGKNGTIIAAEAPLSTIPAHGADSTIAPAQPDNQVLTLPTPGDIMAMGEAALQSSIEGLVAVISSGAIASGESYVGQVHWLTLSR